MYQSIENLSIQRHFVNLGSRQVHYRMSGSGPVLILLHQSPTSSAEMASVIEDLSDEFTVIAPDTSRHLVFLTSLMELNQTYLNTQKL